MSISHKNALGIVTCAAALGCSSAAFAQTLHAYNLNVSGDNGWEPAVATNGSSYGNMVTQHLGATTYAELWYNPGSWLYNFNSGHYSGYPNYQIGPSNPGGVMWQTIAGDSSSSSNTFVSAFEYQKDDGTYLPYLYDVPGTWTSDTGAVTWGAEPGNPTLGAGGYGAYGVSGTDGSAYPEWPCYFQGGYYPSVAMATATNGTQYTLIAFNGYTVSPAGSCSSSGYNGSVFSPGTDMYVAVGTTSSRGGEGLGGLITIPTQGKKPSIAIWPITSGTYAGDLGIIEVHLDATDNSFTSLTGVFNVSNNTISWSAGQKYDGSSNGFAPRIAYCRTGGYVIEVHNGGSGAGWYHVGTIATGGSQTVTWESNGYEYASSGLYLDPSVSCNGEYVTETHSTNPVITSSTYFLY